MESMVGGEGPLCMAVLWSLTFVVLIFLALRAYTRIVCVAAYGIDDHLYVLSWVSPLSSVCPCPSPLEAC